MNSNRDSSSYIRQLQSQAVFYNYNTKRQGLARGVPFHFATQSGSGADGSTAIVPALDVGAASVVAEDRGIVAVLIDGDPFTPPLEVGAPAPAPGPAPGPAPAPEPAPAPMPVPATLPTISDLILWLDGADILGTGELTANNAPVAIWKDKSTNARDIIPATGSAAPIYQAGSNSVKFNSGADKTILTTGEPIMAHRNFTIFLVGGYDSVIGTDPNIMLNAWKAEFGSQVGIEYGGQYILPGSGPTYVSANRLTAPFGHVVGQNYIHTIAVDSDPTGTRFRSGRNGTYTDLVSALNNTITDSGRGLTLGGAVETEEDALLYPSKVSINEVLVYSRRLTEAEIKSVERYLGTKWCITPVYDATVKAPIVKSFKTVGNGTWTAPADVAAVTYLVVGGAGGGGGAAGTGSGGGGGGGAVLAGTFEVVPGQTYEYTVGAGGLGGAGGDAPTSGFDGSGSAFATIIAAGGGRGFESRQRNSSDVYSRGGNAQTGLVAPEGGSGGSIRDAFGGGGGGGGAGGAGANGIPGTAIVATGGAGGAGVTSSITGTAIEYGAGGRGGNEAVGNVAGAAGAANRGAGGAGAQATSMGGPGAAGGAGGSGVVILCYSTAFFADIPAPVITSVTGGINSLVVNLTQPESEQQITNYEYSLDGGAFVALSPAQTASPLTISGLAGSRTFTVRIRAAGSGTARSVASAPATGTTYTGLQTAVFDTVGLSSWTAPATTSAVQYLVVGAGGGSGGCYSEILDLSDIKFAASNPGDANTYWVNNDATSPFYGYFYKGFSRSPPITVPVRITAPANITPNGVVYAYNKWYNTEMVYNLTSSFPTVTNVTWVSIPSYNSTYNNNHSGGSGGGAGGEVKYINSMSYDVTPGSTYNIYVGAGGQGGTATTGYETEGLSGEISYFDSIVARGGSGGSQSRKNTATTNGFKNGGRGGTIMNTNSAGTSVVNLLGGIGGDGAFGTGSGYQYNTSVLAGTAGGMGATYNFDGAGNKTFGAGGDGGDPNVAGVVETQAGIGRGAQGVAAAVNEATGGVAGGSGVVMLKYYY